jgi:hypothetical protein
MGPPTDISTIPGLITPPRQAYCQKATGMMTTHKPTWNGSTLEMMGTERIFWADTILGEDEWYHETFHLCGPAAFTFDFEYGVNPMAKR